MNEIIQETPNPEEEQSVPSEPLPEEPSPDPQQEGRVATWVQFPRRAILLVLMFGVAQLLVLGLRGPLALLAFPGRDTPDWSASWLYRIPVLEVIGERLPTTLLLVGAALLLAAVLALIAALAAAGAHWLERRAGVWGTLLKGLGQLLAYGGVSVPSFGLALALIFLLAIQLDLLPVAGMRSLDAVGGMGEVLKHLIMPAFVLAVFPAVLTAQAVARAVTLPRRDAGCRLWLEGLLRGLGALFGQVGGMLSLAALVEWVFNWPGILTIMARAALDGDFPLTLGGLQALAGVVLAGRLVAELFRWLERLARVPVRDSLLELTAWQKKARRVGLILSLVLLVAPLGLAVAGLTIGPEQAVEADLDYAGEGPSAEHPWGTDRIGRDVRARVLRGGLNAIVTVIVVGLLIFLLAGPVGLLAGYLESRAVWWRESLADLVVVPADVMLFFPSIPLVLSVHFLLTRTLSSTNRPNFAAVLAMILVALLPRAVRFSRALWRCGWQGWQRRLLPGLGALLLGILFGGLLLLSAVDFMGLGVPPPAPTLGGMMNEGFRIMLQNASLIWAPGVALWVCGFAFYVAANGLLGVLDTKEPVVRLNE